MNCVGLGDRSCCLHVIVGTNFGIGMADPREDRIDFSRLEKELSAAIEADSAYWRENDAKLRAMDQRVESYDQFRDMVAAAHIKPLDKKDRIGQGKRVQPWNPFSSANSSSSSVNGTSQSKDSSGTNSEQTKVIPKNGHEFNKVWQRQRKSPADRYAYLLGLGGEDLAKIFRAEISFGLLGEMITVLAERAESGDCRDVAAILTGFTRAGRFGLSLDFLSQAERRTLGDLVAQLEKWTVEEPSGVIAGTEPSEDADGHEEQEEEGEERDMLEPRRPAPSSSGLTGTRTRNDPDECGALTKRDFDLLRETYKLSDV